MLEALSAESAEIAVHTHPTFLMPSPNDVTIAASPPKDVTGRNASRSGIPVKELIVSPNGIILLLPTKETWEFSQDAIDWSVSDQNTPFYNVWSVRIRLYKYSDQSGKFRLAL